MRVATWNIRAGGGKRIPQIAEVLVEEDFDLLVLTEYRPLPGRLLLALLEGAGYHVVAEEPDGPHNSICVLSRYPFEVVVSEKQPASVHRWAVVKIPVFELTMLAVHMPNPTEPWNRQEFWDGFHHFSECHLGSRAMIIGDFNAALNEDCEGKLVSKPGNMTRLHESGWLDAWRHKNPTAKEYTWYSHRQNGFRIDHCVVTPALVGLVTKAMYRHDVRTGMLSDHSLMIVEFDF